VVPQPLGGGDLGGVGGDAQGVPGRAGARRADGKYGHGPLCKGLTCRFRVFNRRCAWNVNERLCPPASCARLLAVAGYSGTPLHRKLGIAPGNSVLLDGAPGDFTLELFLRFLKAP
jgi:hypothetical protein